MITKMTHKPKRNLVSNFKPYGLFISKTLFATGLTNFKRDNLKTFKESLLRISRSSLFHSVIVEGKKEFLKKLLLVLRLDILSI